MTASTAAASILTAALVNCGPETRAAVTETPRTRWRPQGSNGPAPLSSAYRGRRPAVCRLKCGQVDPKTRAWLELRPDATVNRVRRARDGASGPVPRAGARASWHLSVSSPISPAYAAQSHSATWTTRNESSCAASRESSLAEWVARARLPAGRAGYVVGSAAPCPVETRLGQESGVCDWPGAPAGRRPEAGEVALEGGPHALTTRTGVALWWEHLPLP